MKLLMYSHFFAPSVGGVETIVLSLARGLAELRDKEGRAQFEIVLVTEIPAGDFLDTELPFQVIRNPGWFQLVRLILESDVVHLAGPALGPLMLAYAMRKPVVVEHHGFQTICPNGQLLMEPTGVPCPGNFMAGKHAICLRCNAGEGWAGSLKLWLLTFVRRFLCVRVAANITPTQWLENLVQLPRTVSIAHGLEKIREVSNASRGSQRPALVFLGRLVSAKGVRVLIQAAKILQERNHIFHLLIIGDGPERASLELVVRDSELGARVQFLGKLGKEQLEAALSGATAVVVPSLGGEVFGLVVAECMARGLPVVASDLGAFAEVMGDAGIVFRNGDLEDLTAKLGGLLNDLPLAARIGDFARKRALENYSCEAMVDSHAALYQRTVFGVGR